MKKDCVLIISSYNKKNEYEYIPIFAFRKQTGKTIDMTISVSIFGLIVNIHLP